MAVRSTQCQNRAVRSTQGGRGVSPSIMLYYHFMETRPIKNISCLNPQHIISIKTLSVASTKHMIQHCGIDALNQNTDTECTCGTLLKCTTMLSFKDRKNVIAKLLKAAASKSLMSYNQVPYSLKHNKNLKKIQQFTTHTA